MTSGCQGTQYFRRYNRELVSKTGDFVKEKLGEGGRYRRTSPPFVARIGAVLRSHPFFPHVVFSVFFFVDCFRVCFVDDESLQQSAKYTS